ncbi:MAG: [FeFe] hydrogenase H-cluster maturation GTPase HydF [Spirochaetota bacterium]
MKTPKGFRLHIGIFGRRNAGKSSIINAVTGQNISIVSETAGTTTDPVEKAMELQPIGPVLFIDTAGIDDTGDLGLLRVSQTEKVIERTDLAIIVTDSAWGEYEETLCEKIRAHETPLIAVINKIDVLAHDESLQKRIESAGIPAVRTSAQTGEGIMLLKQAIIHHAPADAVDYPNIAGDLVGPGKTAVLVVPIDKEAPKGRLILPQVQTIRDLLDSDAMAYTVKERELALALKNLREKPAIVITDSQAFLKVAADTPNDIPLTSFSILFARFKGDLITQAADAMTVDLLAPGDRILIAEACTHHPITDDIGTVKIPRWLSQYVGGKLDITHVSGRDFPDDLSSFKLVIHCGACTWNRKTMISRILACKNAGVPITNYGLVISYSLGIFERALRPFPAAYDEYIRRKEELAV